MTAVTVSLRNESNPEPQIPFHNAGPMYLSTDPQGRLRPVPVSPSGAIPSGAHKQPASAEQVAQWCTEGWAHYGTGVIPADGWCFLDLDDRGAEQVAALGIELPPTLYSTSRGAGHPRRKALYRIPAGTHLREHPQAPNVDMIDSRTRYARVSPSVNGKTGTVEAWFGPDDSEATPDAATLDRVPYLPESALQAFAAPQGWTREHREIPAYSGRTQFDHGTPDRITLATLQQFDLSRYMGCRDALWFLAQVAVSTPDLPGLGTAVSQVISAYEMSGTAGTPHAQRRPKLEGAFRTALAEHAHRAAEAETHRGFLANVTGGQTPEDAEAAFWASRPYLAHCLKAAAHDMVSPWAVLSWLIQFRLVNTSYRAQAVTFRGGVVLNTCYALVAGTGGGKTASRKTALKAFAFPETATFHRDTSDLASGEGIPGEYVAWDTETKAETWANPLHSQLFYSDEVSELLARSGRSAATLTSAITKSVTGESLARSKAGGREAGLLSAESYRFCYTVGMQPELAGPLVGADSQASGLTGRMVFWDASVRPGKRSREPLDVFTLPSLNWDGFGFEMRVPVDVDDELEAWLGAEDADTRSKAESQAMVSRLVLSAALAMLDGRIRITTDDWTLAAFILDHSRQQRARVLKAVAAHEAAANMAKARGNGQFKAEAADAEAEAVDAAVARVAERIKALQAEQPDRPMRGEGGILQALNSRQRRHATAALESLGIDPTDTMKGGE